MHQQQSSFQSPTAASLAAPTGVSQDLTEAAQRLRPSVGGQRASPPGRKASKSRLSAQPEGPQQQQQQPEVEKHPVQPPTTAPQAAPDSLQPTGPSTPEAAAAAALSGPRRHVQDISPDLLASAISDPASIPDAMERARYVALLRNPDVQAILSESADMEAVAAPQQDTALAQQRPGTASGGRAEQGASRAHAPRNQGLGQRRTEAAPAATPTHTAPTRHPAASQVCVSGG